MLPKIGSIGFCSDLHLGHNLAAEKRGYASVQDHDDEIIKTLQSQTRKKSVLWILGDAAMTIPALERLKEVKCRKWLLFGNHDNFDSMVYLKVFNRVGGFQKYKGMWLSHCPIHPQEMIRGTLNVHGHIHDGGLTGCLPFPYLNVNWDFHRRALTLEEVRAHVKEEESHEIINS